MLSSRLSAVLAKRHSVAACYRAQLHLTTTRLNDGKIVNIRVAKKLPKIYTRTGDGGNSSLYTGERRHKTDKVFSALGTVDELSCHLGLAKELASSSSAEHPYVDQMVRVQCILQDIGSCVATPPSSARQSHLDNVGLSQRHAGELEEWIDEYTTVSLKNGWNFSCNVENHTVKVRFCDKTDFWDLSMSIVKGFDFYQGTGVHNCSL